MLPVPNLNQPLVLSGGFVNSPWNQFFQQFVQAPTGIIELTLGSSPFTYQAREPGTILITGGTVTGFDFTRGDVTLDILPSLIMPVSIKDIVEIAYSVLPTVYFIPR